MKGVHEVVVRSNRVQFKFAVQRNITVLRGDSATGKTTLISMIDEYLQNGADSGVEVRCDRPCIVLDGKDWELRLSAIEDSIVFIDEGNAFVVSNDFARAIKKTSNYYVIAVREALPALPYSVDEIYGIRNTTARRQKYLPVVRVYSSFFRLYGSNAMHGAATPDYVVVEDSNSGFDFFEALCGKAGIPCVSAVGKSNIYDAVRRADAESVLVVADGAAFGPEMEKVLSLGHAKHVSLFLPESFEWLILKSGLVEPGQVAEILNNPADFIESRDYFSWEIFFTACLMSLSKEGYLHYSKAHLNPNYLKDKEFKALAFAAEREGFPTMQEISSSCF